MNTKETFEIKANLYAIYEEYFNERLGKKISDVDTILLNGRFNKFVCFDGVLGEKIDYDSMLKLAYEKIKIQDSLDVYLKVKDFKICVVFSGNKDEGGLDLVMHPIGNIFTKKYLNEDSPSLDLTFYLDVLIRLSEGFMLGGLDARILNNQSLRNLSENSKNL